MDKIKICHVVNIITGKSDGVYAHLKMLFKYLDKEKYEQYLIFQGNTEIEEEVKKLGVQVYALPSFKKKFSLSSFTQLYKIIKKNKIDIIQAHLIKPYIFVGFINLFLRKKAIFNYHGSFIQNDEYYTFLEETIYSIAHFLVFLFRSFHCVVVPSQASQKILSEETRFLPAIKVYYNGYPQENGLEMEKEKPDFIIPAYKKKFKIGVIGRFDSEKRVDIAIQIAHRLSLLRSDFHFFILGNGALEESIKNLVDELHISHIATVIGFVPNIRKYLNVFDLILLTSDREAMPFIVWEAMASGVPLVASDVGGIGEIVEKEESGCVFERRNITQAVTMLNFLLNDEQARIEMGKNGKRAIKDTYNEQEFAKCFDDIYTNN